MYDWDSKELATAITALKIVQQLTMAPIMVQMKLNTPSTLEISQFPTSIPLMGSPQLW